MDKFRIAIAGIGAVAEMHAKSISDISGAELVAGSCRTEEKGRSFAVEYGCAHYKDTETMLDETDPDVLIVCTPSGTHREQTLTAAKQGVHVLCEKPLEISTKRIDEMISCANKEGIRLGGIFPQRYNPLIRELRDAVVAERFGGLAVTNAYVPWWREDAYYKNAWQGTKALDGGGAVMNQSIHTVDAIQWLAGAALDLDRSQNPVAEVFAYTDTLAHDENLMEVEDTAVAVLRFRNGAIGQLLSATSMYPGSLKRIQIAGRGGTAEVLEDEVVTWQFRDEHAEDSEIRDTFTDTTTGGGAADPMSIDYQHHRRNIESYLKAVSADEPFMLDGPEARKAIEIVEAIYESADRNEPVRLN